MKQINALVIFIFYLSPILCQAQENKDNGFSIDFSYAFTGFSNHGWGIGISYQRNLFNCLLIKVTLGHMTFSTNLDDVYNTSVSISSFVNYYPISNEFEKLYIGVGNGCDFMNYFGSGDLPPTTQDTLINITPQIGWRLNLFNIFMIDVSTGYKFIIYNTQNYDDIKDYLNTGFQFGFGIKVFLKNLFKEKPDD